MGTLNAFVRRHSGSNASTKRLTLPCSDFTLKCIGDFVVNLNIIERSNQLRVLLEFTGKVVRAFN